MIRAPKACSPSASVCSMQHDVSDLIHQLWPRVGGTTPGRTCIISLSDFFTFNLFVPVFNEYLGMFTNTLRHFDIGHAHGTERQLLCIICQFHFLEDLTIAVQIEPVSYPAHSIPAIAHPPPLRGKLVLVWADSGALSEGLAALPGGLDFRSLELF